MLYNTAAELILSISIHSTLCLGLAWTLDRLSHAKAKLRLWTWNLALLAALALSIVPHIPHAALSCPLFATSTIYLNRIFHTPLPLEESGTMCLATMMTWVWGVGAMLRGTWWLISTQRLRVLLGRRRVCGDPRLLACLHKSRQTLGVSHEIRLSIHPDFASPVTISGREICLSQSVLSLSDQEIQAVMGHELCHIQRQDHLKIPLLELARCLLWFIPLWPLFASCREDCVEAICDAGGSQTCGSPHAMARALVAVAQHRLGRPGFVPCLGTGPSHLTSRVHSLLTRSPHTRAHTYTRALLLGLGLLLVGLFQSYAPKLTMHISDPLGCTKTHGTSA